MTLPERTLRHFDGDPPLDLARPGDRARALAVLLEHGDREDLRALFREISPAAARAFVARSGPRRLTRRSRALWSAVFGVAPAAAPATARELWPLA